MGGIQNKSLAIGLTALVSIAIIGGGIYYWRYKKNDKSDDEKND